MQKVHGFYGIRIHSRAIALCCSAVDSSPFTEVELQVELRVLFVINLIFMCAEWMRWNV